MINSQLRTSGVTGPLVLERMNTVPREAFVPAAQRAAAYIDRSLPLDDAHQLPPPLFHGLMLQEARLDPQDRVLVVSPAPGYLEALVAPLVNSVTAIAPSAAAAGEVPEGGYSLLLIDGAAEQVPAPLLAALTPAGRVVTGLVQGQVQRLCVGRVVDGRLAAQPVLELGIPRIPEFDQPRVWRF